MAKKFDIEKWKAMRQECRTDLWRLCQVLGYKDVGKPHLRMIRHCQKFLGGTESLSQVTLKTGAGYKPQCSMWELEGKRKKLSLITRGGLKTTILTQAHTIQWVINYPDVRLLLVSAQLGRAKDFLKGIKEHFTKNEIFRWLFPEYCPKNTESGKIEDFGNDEQFTVPCRRVAGIKEPTVRVASSDSSVAGGHYDVIKVDDLVEDQNTRTPGGIEQTRKFFGSLWPLLETSPLPPGHGWLDVTGTIYHFSDLHQTIFSSQAKKPEDDKEWSTVNIPAASEWPITEKTVIWWPERIGASHLKKIEADPALGLSILYPQYLLRPLQDKDGLIRSRDDINWIPRKELNALKPRINWNVTIDLAGMDSSSTNAASDNDYECINLHGWGTDGRCYFDKIFWGRFEPDEVINKMFWLFAYQPRIMFFKIEEETHEKILRPYIKKAMAERGVFLPVMQIKRDTRASKQHRIRGSQPYWKNGAFRFVDDIPDDTKNELELEALYFPKFNHDDILDTVADSLQSRDGSIMPDVEGRDKTLPELGPDFDGQMHEWKGIPVECLSQAALNGMEDESAEYSSLFQPW